jgi:hypothetical protein
MATGRKTGGRKAGTPNKATSAKAAAIVASGMTPLDYMLSVIRDETRDPAMRLDAAKAAAPYVHPRLASVEVGNRDDKPLEISVEERERKAAEARRKAQELIAAAFSELPPVGGKGAAEEPPVVKTAGTVLLLAEPANAGSSRFVEPAPEVKSTPVECDRAAFCAARQRA